MIRAMINQAMNLDDVIDGLRVHANDAEDMYSDEAFDAEANARVDAMIDEFNDEYGAVTAAAFARGMRVVRV